MNGLFLVIRGLAGLASVGALLLLGAVVLLRSGLAFAKEGAGVLGYVLALFTSGFTKGTPPKEPAGWVIGLPQAGLVVLFVAMLVSVFLPGTRWLLHVTAVMAGLALLWYGQMLRTEPRLEILCLPFVAVWLGFYAVCLFAMPTVEGAKASAPTVEQSR